MSHEHIYLEYSISITLQMFYVAYMCLQADETPCTILYLIKRQKVDVGKLVITKPLDLTFHNQPMTAGHFRVTLSSVTSGHEDLPPPLRLGERTTRPHQGLEAARVGCCYGRRIFFVWSRLRAHQ